MSFAEYALFSNQRVNEEMFHHFRPVSLPKPQRSFREDLNLLLEDAYAKGQAYYRKDFYGSHEDEDQEWDHCYEKPYKKAIKSFLEKYGEGR